MEKEDNKLSHRQKQRQVKRVQKKQNEKPKKVKQPKQVYNSDSEEENVEAEEEQEPMSQDEEEIVPVKGFSDDNSSWLKPKQKKGAEPEPEESGEEEDVEEDSEDEGKVKVGKLFDEEDDDDEENDEIPDDNFADSDDSGEEEEEKDDSSDDDEKLPIEKANKKLKKQEEEEAKLAEDEQQMSVLNQEIFQIPEEQDGEEKPITLQDIQQRIKDVTLVLSDFKRYRQEGRSRQEYLEILKKDLCAYYSYNEFLMTKLMDMFSLTELMEYLESSEVARPLTIRTNTLKTRRKELAQALINRGVNLDPVGEFFFYVFCLI